MSEQYVDGDGNLTGPAPGGRVHQVAGVVENTSALIEQKSGRRFDLSPVGKRAPLALWPDRVDTAIAAGLRVPWGSGDVEGWEFDITCGAGVGSPYMVLTLRKEGEDSIDEVIDMRPFFESWVRSAIAGTQATE
jgi:hypothetical protein